MQQFLIPSSTGSSQIINIPVSLLSQSNQQPISFITANGQIFQIPSFSQLVVQPNQEGGSGGGQSGSAGSAQGQTSSASTSSTPSTTANPAQNGSQQQQQSSQQQQTLVINHQGQLLSLPVLQAASSSGGTQAQQNGAQIQTVNVQTPNQSTQGQNSNLLQAVNLSQIQFTTMAQNSAQGSNGTRVGSANQTGNQNGTTPIKTLLEEDDKNDTSMDDQGPTIANIPNMQSAHQITHATTVDGVNLDEIREFAKAFKLRRLALGLTQTQVGQALSATKGPAYSQSAICRFEKLDITPKSAAKIKPVLEKWMQEAELKYADRLKSGTHTNFADLLGTENTKKRKRRTSFTPQALEILNDYFEKNTHPSGNQGADMTMLAQKLNYDREVIRVWFCNKRQALKNTMKKLKAENADSNSDASLSPNSSSNSISQTLNNQMIQQQQQQQQQQAVMIVNNQIDQAHIQELAHLASQQNNANTPTKTVITLTNTKLEPQIQSQVEQGQVQTSSIGSDDQTAAQNGPQVQTVVVGGDITSNNNSQENAN